MQSLTYDLDLPEDALPGLGVACVTVDVAAEFEPAERERAHCPGSSAAWLCYFKGVAAAYDGDGDVLALSECDRKRVSDWLQREWEQFEPYVEQHMFASVSADWPEKAFYGR